MIIRRGSRVNDETRAIAIANAVNNPNNIVGMKFESDKIENPMVIATITVGMCCRLWSLA